MSRLVTASVTCFVLWKMNSFNFFRWQFQFKQLLLSSLLFNLISIIIPYNVDTNHPIIISNVADGPESFFGATVQLFRKSGDASWILVGAPRANSTYVNHTTIFEPGVIWRCSIGKKQEVCEPVLMDYHGEGFYEPAVADRKYEAWLGGVMSDSTSDRFVTCASRWANNPYWWKNPQDESNIEYLLHGICYWRPKDDILEESIGPVPNKYRLLPLKPVPSIPETLTKQGGFYWTYGQTGFSSHVAPDQSLILGAPGILGWKGSVIHYTDGQGPPRVLPNGERDLNSNTFANSFVARPELETWLEYNTYFGYAVGSGKFFTENSAGSDIQYVAGAPRGKDMAGEVTVFNFPETQNEPLKLIQRIIGQQVYSYFGSVISAVDLNGDGLDDLIIGAPRYTSPFRRPKLPVAFAAGKEPSGETSADSGGKVELNGGSPPQFGVKIPGAFSQGDEGAAFVYISTGSTLEYQETIQGDNQPWAQFGTAIASAGDLNHDGYNDVIIGAPYQDGHHGCVYIYHGSANGIKKEYSQKICAIDVDPELRGFGYGVSRGLDVDDNGYEDIAIGSYASAHAIIFRSKPMLVVTGEIKSSVAKLPLNADGFKLTSCIRYTGHKVPSKLVIGVRVLTDTDVKPPRVLVKQPELDGSTYKELVYEELAYADTETCTELEAVVIKKNFGANVPIKIRQQVFLLDKDQSTSGKVKRSASHFTKYEIQRERNLVRVDVSGKDLGEFCKTCPVLSNPDSDTTTLNLPLEVRCGDDEKCTADLGIQATFENIKPGDNFTIGSAPTLTLLISVKNFLETAMSPAVIVSYGRRNLARIPPTCKTVGVPSTHENAIECSLGGPLEKDQVADTALVFDMSDLIAGKQAFEKEYFFHIEATTTSEMVQPSTLNLLLPVNATADVHLHANRNEILFSTTTLAKYQIMSHTYDIRLHGPSPIADMWLRFKIPVNLTQEQTTNEILQVFYPKADVDGTDVFCTAVNGYFHSSSSDTTATARRRPVAPPDLSQTDPTFDAVMVQPSISKQRGIRDLKKRDTSTVLQSSNKKHELIDAQTIYFDCDAKDVECMEIRCKFSNFKASSRGRVNINLRISSDNARKLFAQEEAHVLVIQSVGEINLMNVDEDIQMENLYPDKAAASTTIRLDKPKRLRKRYIFAAIIGGLLLLFIIIFGLYSCGCLERKSKAADDDVPEEEQSPLQGPESTPASPVGDPLDPIAEEHEGGDSDSEPPSFVP